MADVIPADGSKLYLGSTAEPPVYDEVGNILSISFPSAEVGEVDVSNLGSGQTLKFRPGRTDPGEVTFDLQFDPADAKHAEIRALLYGVPAVRAWRITVPTTPAMGEDFVGFVKSCPPAVEGADGNLEATVTIRVSGAATPYTAS